MTLSHSGSAGADELTSPFHFRGTRNFVRAPKVEWTRVLAGSLSTEMMIWLGQHVERKWSVLGTAKDKVVYYFEDADEAFAFMMRFGGGKIGLTT